MILAQFCTTAAVCQENIRPTFRAVMPNIHYTRFRVTSAYRQGSCRGNKSL